MLVQMVDSLLGAVLIMSSRLRLTIVNLSFLLSCACFVVPDSAVTRVSTFVEVGLCVRG